MAREEDQVVSQVWSPYFDKAPGDASRAQQHPDVLLGGGWASPRSDWRLFLASWFRSDPVGREGWGRFLLMVPEAREADRMGPRSSPVLPDSPSAVGLPAPRQEPAPVPRKSLLGTNYGGHRFSLPRGWCSPGPGPRPLPPAPPSQAAVTPRVLPQPLGPGTSEAPPEA